MAVAARTRASSTRPVNQHAWAPHPQAITLGANPSTSKSAFASGDVATSKCGRARRGSPADVSEPASAMCAYGERPASAVARGERPLRQ